MSVRPGSGPSCKNRCFLAAVLVAGALGGCANLPSNLYHEVLLDEPLPQKLRNGDRGGVYCTEPSPGTLRFSDNEGVPLCDRYAKLTVWLDSEGVVRAKRLETSGDCWLIPFVVRRSSRTEMAISVGRWVHVDAAGPAAVTTIGKLQAKYHPVDGRGDLAGYVTCFTDDEDLAEWLCGKKGRRWLAADPADPGTVNRGDWVLRREGDGSVRLRYRRVEVDSAISRIRGARAISNMKLKLFDYSN